MNSFLDALRVELTDLSTRTTTLAAETRFKRIDENGRTVTALVPDEMQQLAIRRHVERFDRWQESVLTVLRRRGIQASRELEKLLDDFGFHLRLGHTDIADVTQGVWRAAFARDGTRLFLALMQVLDEHASELEPRARRTPIEHAIFPLGIASDATTWRIESENASTEIVAPPETPFAPRLQQSLNTLAEIGQSLYQAVFNGSIAYAYATARQQAGGRPLSLRVTASGPAVRRPWELLHDGAQFLALSD